jgi:hypothetical protein
MQPDELEPMSDSLNVLLDAERVASKMPSAVRNRLLERLGTEILSGAVAGTAVASATAQAAPAAVAPAAAAAPVTGIAKATVIKLVVGVGVAAFATGGLVGAGVTGLNTHASDGESPVPARAVVLAAPPLPELVVPPADIAPPPPLTGVAPSPSTKNVARAPVLADALGIERSLLEQARTALSRGNAVDALTALAEHEGRFPAGQMAEERAAMQVLTLKALGRVDEARARAEQFRAKYPKGIFRASVDAAVP